MTIAMAAAACGGTLVGAERPDAPIGRAVIDSRAVQPGDLFVAYRGEKTDGHRYIPTAWEKGAVCALAEYLPEGAEEPLFAALEGPAAEAESLGARLAEKIKNGGTDA